jgi:uncharacterized protein YkwD
LVVWNNRLGRAAQNHAEDLYADDGELSHTGLDGSDLTERLQMAGYTFSTAAENLAAGTVSAADTVDEWMDSSVHCQNIMNGSVTEIGIGKAGSGSSAVWVLNVAAP